MIPVGTAVGYLTLDYSQFSTNLKTAIGEATSLSGKFSDTFGKGLTTLGNQISSVGTTLTTGLTLPIGAATASAVKFGAEFDKQMSSVAAVSGATTQEMKTMRDAAISWGEKTVYSATESAEALYYMSLAGWDVEKSVAALGPVLNLAAAGDLELGRTSDIVTDAMTAMGYEAGELTNGVENTTYFTNSLAAAMSHANTDVDQMGEAFKYVSPLAGSLNMDISDLSLAIGLMANVGVKGTQAGTGLRQALKNLIAPTDQMQAAMDKYGVSLFDTNGKAKDMRTFMEELRGTFGNLEVDIYDANGELKTGEQIMEEYGHALPTTQQEKLNAVVEIFGTRALPGILGIINQPEKKFNDLADAIDNSNEAFVEHEGTIYTMEEALATFGEEAVRSGEGFTILGAAEGQAKKQMDNLYGDWTMFTSALGTSKILISDLVNNELRGFVQKLTELVQKFNGLDEEQKKHILKIAATIAAIGPMLIIFGKLVSGIGGVITGFQRMSEAFNLIKTGGVILTTKLKNIGEAANLARGGFSALATEVSPLGAAIGGITAPIAAIIAIIALLVAAFVHLWNTNEDFRNNITETWEKIKAKFSEFFQHIVDKLNELGFEFEDIKEVISAIWNGFCELLAPVFEGAWKAIEIILSTVLDVISGIIDFWVDIFNGNWEGAWNDVVGIFKSIWNGIKEQFGNILDIIKGVVDVFLGWIGTNWSEVWTKVKDFVSDTWEKIKEKISTTFENIKEGIKTKLESIKTTKETIWTSIKEFVSNIWENMKTKISTTFETIKSTIHTIIENIQTKLQNVWTAIKTFISETVENIKNKVKEKFEEMKTNTETTITNLKQKAEEKFNEIKEKLIEIGESIKTKVKEKFDEMKEKVLEVIGNLKTEAETKTQEVKDGILGVFSDIKAKFEEVGSNIIAGIKNGISNGWEALKKFVEEKASSLLTAAKAKLGIKSPSRAFRDEVGVWIPAGIAEGFAIGLPSALKSIQDNLDKGVESIDTEDVDIIGISDTFKDVVVDMVNWFDSIEERLADIVDNIKMDLSDLIGVGQLVLNSDGTLSGLVYNKPGGSLVTSEYPNTERNNIENITNITFNSPKAIDEIEAAKLLKETQRDLAEGF